MTCAYLLKLFFCVCLPARNTAGIIAGSIIAVLLILLLLAIILFCFCRARNRKKYEKEICNEIRYGSQKMMSALLIVVMSMDSPTCTFGSVQLLQSDCEPLRCLEDYLLLVNLSI